METNAKFKVVYSKDADDFLNQLPEKVRDKTKDMDTLVIATHGFIKKTQKTPLKEIFKAEEIKKAYFNSKK